MSDQNNILLIALAGVMNQKYLDMIDFQNTQIKVLKEIVDKKRFPLTNDQRRLLAAKFKELDKEIADEFNSSIVIPSAVLQGMICRATNIELLTPPNINFLPLTSPVHRMRCWMSMRSQV